MAGWEILYNLEEGLNAKIIYTSSTRTRRGGSCLKDMYKTFLIYRTCMRRAPAKPVRACTLRKLCPASHVTCEAPLRTSHSTLHTSHCTLRTPHFTLHTALFALQTSHSTVHTALFALQTSHSTLHTSHFSLHTSHSTLYTSRFTLLTAFFRLHTSYFTLYTSQSTLHTSHCFLHTPHTSSLHREAFTHSKLSHTARICTQNTYTQCFYTWQALTHTHTETFTQISFYTQQTFTRNIFYTQQAFTHSKRLDTEHLHTVLTHSAFTHGKRLQTNFSTQELQLQNRISTPKQKKDDFEAFFKRKITSAKIAKICWQITIAAWMQPLQYDLQSSAAKDNSITHAAAAASNLDAAIPMRSATGDSKTPYNYAHTSRPKAASSHHYTAARKKRQTDRSRNRRTDEVPFIAGCSHFTQKNARFRASASTRKQSPCNIMQPLMRSERTDSKTPYNYARTSTPKAAWSNPYNAAKKKANRPQPQPPHRRGTFHRRLQPLYTEKHKVSCSGFLPKQSPCNIMQPFQCDLNAQIPKHPI